MTNDFDERRKSLIQRLEDYRYIRGKNAKNIKKAMLKVKREDFVMPEHRSKAYDDTPLPIPADATISAPHMHAMYLSSIDLKAGDNVLEIGAGSGILLAYVKEIVGPKGKVVGVEIVPEVYRFAKNNIEKAGYAKKIQVILGDGTKGVDKKKFDKILISAACPKVPVPLLDNLKSGGILIAPIGEPYGSQELLAVKKERKGNPTMKSLGSVVFVPLRGEYGWK